MPDFFFVSYSSVDGKDFALKLSDELVAGPPTIAVWLDKRALRPGEDWDDQVTDAIRRCKGLIFVMSADSVRSDSVCKSEWVRALRYKKPVIPLLLDRDAELPFRLGSREYVNFTGEFDSAVARLRKHLGWMDSPEGQLQALKHRLSDAQRELPRADAEQQARIEEDIAELKRQIAQQQSSIDNPRAAENRVQQSIAAGLEGERKPTKPAGGLVQARFIYPPPLIAPTWFQNRHFETGQIGEFLADESLRLMTIVGRGGVGKSAMVCRLLRSLESGQLPDDGGPLAVDGIVYLSAARSFHRTNLPDLYAGLAQLLSDDTVRQLDAIYRNPQSTTRATMEALGQAFPRGRTIVLLDNFEDELAVETGQIKNAELDEALRAILELPPHGLKIIITTRVAPGDLALVQPGLQRRLDLETGLEHPHAENILRAMDADGKVRLRDAPDALLAIARDRTLGYPRALEHLFGILSADRNTSLQEILDNTRHFLPERVVAVLAGEAFSRLDPTAQRVMQALAIFRYPVPPSAVDYLLQSYVTGIDSGRVLSRLVNMQFVRRDAGRYYLHQVDRDYALTRIAEGGPEDRDAETPPLTQFALRHRAAEWFELSRKPREAWKTLDDLAAQLSEFELRCEGEDYDTAASVLLEFDFHYLLVWGHYRLMTDLHERLQGRISDPDIEQSSVGNLGTAYYRMGQLQRATELYERALGLARARNDRWGEAVWLGNLGLPASDLGQTALAVQYYEQALAIRREIGDRSGQSLDLGNLANRYADIGQNTKALGYYEEALLIDRETENRESEAEDLNNVGECCRHLGRYDESFRYQNEAIVVARAIGYRLILSASQANIGRLHALSGNWDQAARELERAVEIADDVGNPQLSRAGRESLAWAELHRGNVASASDLATAARKYDVPMQHSVAALAGVVALRQGDIDGARREFLLAVNEASRVIGLTAEWYEAHEVQGLSLCGLALCGDRTRIAAARTAYASARAITTDAGILKTALQQFDLLATSDTEGLLTAIRAVAAGEKSQVV